MGILALIGFITVLLWLLEKL
jgi:hypothetical protein